MTYASVHLGCRKIPAFNHSGKRTVKPTFIVIHSTESPNEKGSAVAVARFFQRPSTQASVQLVMDDYQCVRCLDDDVIPWGAPPFNSYGLHIEQCGYAHWTGQEWLQHKATIQRTAQASAYLCKAYDIPVRFLTPLNCKARIPGITSHRNVSLAFGQSDHTDPGADYPIDYFMAHVKDIYYGLP